MEILLSLITSIYIGWNGGGKWKLSLTETFFLAIITSLIINLK